MSTSNVDKLRTSRAVEGWSLKPEASYTPSVPAFRRLLPYIRRYQRQFTLGLGCVVVTSSITLTAPWVLKYAIDDLTRGVTRNKLALYGSLLLGIACAGGYFRFWMRRILIGASRHIEYDIRNDFFAKLEQFPLAYYQAHRTGDLMSRATNDLNAVRMMIGPAVMYSANTIIVFFVSVALMLKIDPWLAGIALIPLPFISISVKYFGGAIHRAFELVQAQLSDVSAVVQESLAGVRVVRAYRQEQAETNRFAEANREYVRRNRLVIRMQGMFFPTIALLLGLAALLVLWLGSREVINGRITLGELVAFSAYLERLSWPMIAFGWVTNMLQRGMASWKRMLEVLDAEVAIKDEAPAAAATSESASQRLRPELGGGAPRALINAEAPAIRGAIEFRNLTFAYNGWSPSYGPSSLRTATTSLDEAQAENSGEPGRTSESVVGRPVLEGISVRIEPGQTVAIVGPTGSGKSTMVSLLARLHDPAPGTVFVDGVDVRNFPLATLRGAIGFVPQEPFLFSDTVAENVAFGGTDGKDGSARGRCDERRAGPPARQPRWGASRGATASGGGAPRALRKDGSARGRCDERRAGPPRWSASRGATVSGGGAPRALRKEKKEERDGNDGKRLLERVERASAIARLDKDVESFPKRYDTMVGERGITLSGGQKQRTAIARALFVDPPILILDDALSAVDTYTEEEILSQLRGVMRQRTSIIISHRISTVRDADQILVLDQGRLVERGRHEELVEQGRLYAELYRKQLLEEELAKA